MIYLESNRHNCSLVSLYKKKEEFLDKIINIHKNKMFYMVLYNNGFLNKNQKEFVGLLDAVKSEIYGEDIDFFFEDIKDISETIDRNSKRDLGVLKSPATNNKKNAETKEVLKAINKEAEKESGEGILSKQEIEDRLLKSKRESRKRVTIKSVNSIP